MKIDAIVPHLIIKVVLQLLYITIDLCMFYELFDTFTQRLVRNIKNKPGISIFFHLPEMDNEYWLRVIKHPARFHVRKEFANPTQMNFILMNTNCTTLLHFTVDLGTLERQTMRGNWLLLNFYCQFLLLSFENHMHALHTRIFYVLYMYVLRVNLHVLPLRESKSAQQKKIGKLNGWILTHGILIILAHAREWTKAKLHLICWTFGLWNNVWNKVAGCRFCFKWNIKAKWKRKKNGLRQIQMSNYVHNESLNKGIDLQNPLPEHSIWVSSVSRLEVSFHWF